MIDIPSLPPGYTLAAFDDIPSTNAEAKRLAVEEDAPEGTVVWALRQSAGRGRHGREWISEAGNLYCSILLRPDCPISEAAQIGFLTPLAVADAIREVSPAISIKFKWPNDVLLTGKKVAGILLESSSAGGDKVDWVVVGVGINLASHPEVTDFPATSMGLGVEVQDMLEIFCVKIEFWYGQWRDNGFPYIRDQWLRHGPEIGENLRIRSGEKDIFGTFQGIDDNGGLELKVEGRLQRFDFGDVFFAETGN